MGTNSSSPRRQAQHGVRNVPPFVIVHNTQSTYKINPHNSHHSDQPVARTNFHEPTNNLNVSGNSLRPSNSEQIDFNIKCTNESASKACKDPRKFPHFVHTKQVVFPTPPHEFNSLSFNDATNKNTSTKDHNDKKNVVYTESNKPAKIFVAPPFKIHTQHDFMIMWFSWKDDFYKYVESIEESKTNKHKWGLMLLNQLGPVGQEIYRTFTFENNEARENIDVLVEKFDYYCVFKDAERNSNEEVDTYVNRLKTMASKHSINVDETVKKKILNEMNMDRFTVRAKNLIKDFSISNIQSLTLKEIIYIWMTYENVNYKQCELIDNIVRNCGSCARTHVINKCPAYGKQCNTCGNDNHFWTRCPSRYNSNCEFCGEDHFYKECPAYENKCSKCDRENHFSWKCSTRRILNCNYCGSDHAASRLQCKALNITCNKCFEKGHIPEKCKRR